MEAKTDSLNHFNLLQSASDDIVQCPLCETKMKRSEVAEHCEQEMGNLKKMQLKAINQLSQADCGADEESNSEERRKPWTVFQRVQKNRQTRLRQRTRRRPASPAERICPLCNQSFAQEDIQRHAEQCLRRTNGTANGDAAHSSDDEDAATDEYEEYEWAGQKRIRVSSLIPGGYAAIGVGQANTHNNNGQTDDEDEDLNVDEDDTQIYGPAQYNESDVLAAGSELNITDVNEEDSDVTNYMRWLITGNANANTITQTTTPPHSDDTKTIDGTISTPANAAEKTTAAEHIIESLKAKLRHYENHVQNKFKCLICLDDYKNPAISVSCWHVHCEQCWMRSLGARKLCPQCNLITTPKDLRRIYM